MEQKIFIAWDNNRMSLGIPVIDEQHKQLVALCNALYSSIMDSNANEIENWRPAFKDALHAAFQYTQKHFSDEEKLMEAVGYSALAVHKIRHKDFIQKLLDTTRTFPYATFQDALKFVRFGYDWILQHIAHEDRLYVKSVIEYQKAHK